MKLELDIQNAAAEPVPGKDQVHRWVSAAMDIAAVETAAMEIAALADRPDAAELSVRFVSEDEMATLNQRYRGKPGPTNVLSFPAELPDGLPVALLGDVVACPAVVRREADQQHKTAEQHWAHMLVHGSLHLLGYDHVDSSDAQQMESLETRILASLGFPCPYQEAGAVTRAGSTA